MSLPRAKQNKYRVKNSEIYKNRPVISSVTHQTGKIMSPVITIAHSHQSGNRVKDVESDVVTSVNTSIDSDQINIVNSDKNKSNNVKNVLNVNTENSKNSDQDIIFAKPLTTRIDRVEIRKKLRNLIRQRMLMKKHKQDKTLDKLFLNQKSKSNDKLLYESENKTNNSLADNNVESCINDDSYRSDYPKFSTNDEETNFRECNSINKLNTSKPATHKESTHSSDPNYLGPLRFHRTLKKVDSFYKTAMSSNILNKVRKPDNIPSCETMLDDGILSKNVIVLDNPLNHEKYVSNSKIKHNESAHKYHIFPQAYKLTNDDIKKFQHLIIEEEEEEEEEEKEEEEEEEIDDDKLYDLNFTLNKSNRQIYELLLNQFNNESHVFNYLMENERMLYNKELILSESANQITIDYFNKHLTSLNNIYGNPKENKADVSYLLDDPVHVREYSNRPTNKVNLLSPPLQPENENTLPHQYMSQTHKNLTTATSTKTEPMPSTRIFNFVPAAGNKTVMSTKPNVNYQPPRFIQPNIVRPNVQSSFKLPTSVRSKGMSFIQTNKSNCPQRPNTHKK